MRLVFVLATKNDRKDGLETNDEKTKFSGNIGQALYTQALYANSSNFLTLG